MLDLHGLTLHKAREMLHGRKISSYELTQEIFKRIIGVEDKINSYITLTEDVALENAKEADRLFEKKEAKSLTGIPLGIKDIFCTKGIKTTCASKILENFSPPYDSTAIEKLKNQGYVLIGKTNMDEFAMGSSTENSAYKKTRNPWALDRIPGGSSGGSAAAVASSEALGALGTDTGGSIRQPASVCGITGLKPTYGRVSRYGVIAFASSLDQVGPMGKTARDCAILLKEIAGHDMRDSTSVDIPVPDYESFLDGNIKGLRVGIPKEYFIEGMDKEVEALVKKAIDDIKGLGARIVEISLPHTEYAIGVYYLIATAEASSNLARYDGVKYGFREDAENLIDMYCRTRAKGFGSEVKRRIMLGTYALSAGYYDAYYKKAQQVRTLIKNDFLNAFKEVDVIATPTSPTVAFRLGEKIDDPLKMYLSDIFTISCNLAGLPGLSVPCGFTSERLPVGLQLLGRHFKEEILLKAGNAYENVNRWYEQKPEL